MKHALHCALVGLMMASAVTAQPLGMGPGMMEGYGGYGMGPGAMWRHDGLGMGPGAMWAWGGRGYDWGIELTAEQRRQIDEIRDETARQHWQLMGTLHQRGGHMQGMFGAGTLDEQEARAAYEAMATAHKAMFEATLAARKRIDAVLTAEQREQLRRRYGGR